MSLMLLLARAPLKCHSPGARAVRLLSTANRCVTQTRVGGKPLLHELRLSRTVPARGASTSTPSETSQAGKKPLYPERLLIYHAGTGRTTFLACLKLTTIFTFAFFGFLATPAYLAAGEPIWKATGIFLCGLIPLVTVAYLTTPFVTSIHIHTPPFARHSRDLLSRWARSSAPSSARLDLTTMTPIGKPRLTTVSAADLRPARARLGTVNYARDAAAAAAEDAARPWWRLRAVAAFAVVPGGEARVRNGWVWTEVAAGIERRAAEAAARR